jgi:hypothetical protein
MVHEFSHSHHFIKTQSLLVAANNHVLVVTDSVAAVLRGMRAHPSQLDVQRCGLEALCALAGNGRNKEHMLGDGAVAMCVSGLQENFRDADVARHGCSLLAVLAFKNNKVKIEISNLGGIDAALRCLRAHSGNRLVLAASCCLLRNLTAQSGLRKSVFGKLF